MTAEELLQRQDDFKNEITFKVNTLLKREDLTDERGIIYDGVGNIEEYVKSSPKVMWILKEPWDTELDNSFCVYDYNITQGTRLNTTIRNMTFSMECFQKDMTYEQLPSLSTTPAKFKETEERVKQALGQIAYINISKILAGRATSDERLHQMWNDWHSLVMKQIKIYEPDVIIFGGTFHVFESKSLGLPVLLPQEPGKKGTFNVYETNMNSKKVTLIETNHPAYRYLGERSELIAETLRKCQKKE